MHAETFETRDISKIAGNASDQVKTVVSNMSRYYLPRRNVNTTGLTFGAHIVKRIQVTEVSVLPKAEEPSKTEGRVVCELTVEEDMLNGGGTIHGGCSAFLIDICSSMSITMLRLATSNEDEFSVSQSLNMVYHSPAGLGDRIRLVNTTLTIGGRVLSARTEIWNVTHHRLVSSGVHIKMKPSAGPTKASL
ncbi:Acyl-coenzyme A thioesterase 13 [Termitomyces sp. T112]|nr:Acyl-coenzyme A thioesterase 13 [Termitomyces sp. T112]